MKRVGVAMVAVNGVAEARVIARHVTKMTGGHGAVREVAELILKAQHKWTRLVADYAA